MVLAECLLSREEIPYKVLSSLFGLFIPLLGSNIGHQFASPTASMITVTHVSGFLVTVASSRRMKFVYRLAIVIF